MKKILKLLIFVLVPIYANGQLTPLSSQYVLNTLMINPAYAGNRGVLNLAAFYRRQWVGIKGSPETMSLSADAPFNDGKLGLGFILQNDKIGVNRETQFNTNYAYRIEMGNGNLSFGLGAAINMRKASWSELIVLDPGDENFQIDSKTYLIPNFSFGTYYSDNNFFAGFSIPKLMGQKFDFNKNKYVLKTNMKDNSYLFNIGFVFDISRNLKFLPSSLVVISPGNSILYDLNANFRIMDRFWSGISYRSDRSVNVLFQMQINDQLKLAYTYDMDFGRLKTYSSGSHEIMLRYEFRYKINAISPLNF